MTFSAATQAWLDASFDAPTTAQRGAWEAIEGGHHTLVIAPTGSGKTLAAFLWAIDQHVAAAPPPVGDVDKPNQRHPPVEPAETPARQILYISPLKALASDVERNLRAPLIGIGHQAARLGLQIPEVTVGVRTGDTPARERQRMVKQPPDIIITTPESLFLMLTSSATAALERVGTVIVDEIHALAGTKRGAHLALSLERLDELLPTPAQRIGLSATVTPPERVADFLAGRRLPSDGGRQVRVVQPPATKRIVIDIESPARDATHIPGGLDTIADARYSTNTTPADRVHEATPADRVSEAHRDPADHDEDLSGDAAGPGLSRRSNAAATYPSSGLEATYGGVSYAPGFDAEPGASDSSAWPAVERRIVDLIATHRSTLVFVNSRRTAEKLTARLNEEWARRAGLTNALGDDTLDNTSQWPAAITAQAGAALGIDPVIARAHHGSMSRIERTQIEDALKTGRLPAVVATSSLELGIDMGAIDLVVQVGAPPSVASGLQRIGRAGHQVGEVSRGVMLPLHRQELVPAAVTAIRMRERTIEPVHDLTNPLDVLSQQIVAAVAMADWNADDLAALVRRATPFATLGDATWAAILDMLAGRYPSEDFAELRPRLTWDRATGTLSARRGSALIAVTSGGTIPDRGLYPVVLAGGDDGPRRRSNRVGELDEEMVYESRVGDAITLGSSTWRIEEITPQQVIVTPAPGLPGRLPFWKGDGPGRPAELGAAIGAFTRRIDTQRRGDPAGAHARLVGAGMDEPSASDLLALLAEQHDTTGRVPDDKTLIVERFRDELGDWRIVVHSPFGSRVHAPWALVVGARIREQFGLDASVYYTDDGIVLRMPPTGDTEEPGLPAAELLIEPAEVFTAVREQITGSAMFAGRFREAAARALLLPRRRPGMRQPLWQQRHRAAQLLGVAAKFPDFPIVIEAVRECLQDDFDLPALAELMTALDTGRVRMLEVTTDSPSPFARSLLFSYTGNFLYDSDVPLAERKAVALSLDPVLLAEILGGDDAPDLAELLDPAVVAQVSAEVARTAPGRQATSTDNLWDLLRSHGPLTRAEIEARVAPDIARTQVDAWLSAETGRLVFAAPKPGASVAATNSPGLAQGANVGDNSSTSGDDSGTSELTRATSRGVELWWAATDDAARLRDGLGVPLPPGLAQAQLAPVADPLGDLARRFARTHGPFSLAELAEGLALTAPLAAEIGRRLAADGQLVPGPTRQRDDGAREGTWVDPDVLRRIRRRTLAVLRGQVEAVDPAALGRFVPVWQHLGTGAPSGHHSTTSNGHTAARVARNERIETPTTGALRGVDGVLQVVEQLAGARFPASALETFILPARVSDYEPRYLDDLSARGEVLWCGHQALPGARGDGIISLHLTETAALTLPWQATDPDSPETDPMSLAGRLLAALQRGGQFLDSLMAETEAAGAEVAEALWHLTWSSRITSDSFGALRELVGARGGAFRASKNPGRARPGRGLRGLRTLAHGAQTAPPRAAVSAPEHAPPALRHLPAARAGGRWSALPLPSPAAAGAATLRAHADITVLLQRYGVITRTPGLADLVATDAATMYRVLSDMEDQGQVRRGYFVEGLGGAQFALPGAVDELRRFAATPTETQVQVLAATDPANPYGVLLEWPEPTGGTHRPGRRAGAVVVLADGSPVLYLERGGRTLVVLDNRAATDTHAQTNSSGLYSEASADDSDRLQVAAIALADAIRAGQVSRATLRNIADTPALDAVADSRKPVRADDPIGVRTVRALISAGATVHAQGLRLEGPRARG